jgi:hypothetical protein
MRKWTESQAIHVLNFNGAEVRGKIITAKYGLRGLTSCSALDYLVIHCGYKANI